MQNRLRERIKEYGLLQTELAEKLGMTIIGIQKLLSAPMVKIDTYQKFADAMGVPAWKLFLSDEEVAEIAESYNSAIAKAGQSLAEADEDNFFTCPFCGSEFIRSRRTDKK